MGIVVRLAVLRSWQGNWTMHLVMSSASASWC